MKPDPGSTTTSVTFESLGDEEFALLRDSLENAVLFCRGGLLVECWKVRWASEGAIAGLHQLQKNAEAQGKTFAIYGVSPGMADCLKKCRQQYPIQCFGAEKTPRPKKANLKGALPNLDTTFEIQNVALPLVIGAFAILGGYLFLNYWESLPVRLDPKRYQQMGLMKSFESKTAVAGKVLAMSDGQQRPAVGARVLVFIHTPGANLRESEFLAGSEVGADGSYQIEINTDKMNDSTIELEVLAVLASPDRYEGLTKSAMLLSQEGEIVQSPFVFELID